MRQVIKIAIAAATAATMTLAGCAGTPAAPTPQPTDTGAAQTSAPPTGEKIKVGMAFDVGGRGDQSFNDSAAAGLDKAAAEFGVETSTIMRMTKRTWKHDGRSKGARQRHICLK